VLEGRRRILGDDHQHTLIAKANLTSTRIHLPASGKQHSCTVM
jgi:hypothetical protein